MSKVVLDAANSDDNCYHSDLGEIVGHKVDEIYTCLDCLEELIRKAERERIIQLLNNYFQPEIAKHLLTVDWHTYQDLIGLIEDDK